MTQSIEVKTCSKNDKWRRRIIDLAIFICVLTIIGCTVFGYIPPWPHGGIYCNDPSIAFPFQGDSVPTVYLFLGMLLPSFLVIYTTQYFNTSSIRIEPNEANSEGSQANERPFQLSSKKAWSTTRHYYGCLLSGLLFTTLLNEVLKVLVAEPRPHFLDTCRPKNLNCTTSGSFIPYYQIECSQANSARNGVPRAISDAMKSFPSGHAQLSTFVSVFMVIYIQRKIGTSYSFLWKHLLQVAFVCFALVCSISRIIDKRHHWWDVLAGVIIGTFLAIFTVKWHASDFLMSSSERKYSSESAFHNEEDAIDSRITRSNETNLRQRNNSVLTMTEET